MEIDESLVEDRAGALPTDHHPVDHSLDNLEVGAGGPLDKELHQRIGRQRAHEPMFNLPVEINDWPDPGSDDAASDGSNGESIDDLDGDPEFQEQLIDPVNLGLDPLYEPNLNDEQAHDLMQEHLGDLADEEWLNLYNSTLSAADKVTLRFLATRLRTHFSRQTYNELRYGPCESLNIPSEFIAYRRLAILAGFGTRAYDCCVNSMSTTILDNPEDLALGLSTDGFTLFKRRRRGLSTAWPLIFINYNLHPKYRVRLENIICVGVIPGPKQCKDLNSFLIPVLEELLQLEHGIDSVKTTPAGTPEDEDHPEEGEGELTEFKLRAFLIMIFGDIPAVSKLLAMKGHNAMVPCRTCYTQGVLCRGEKNSVYYVPLSLPGEEEGYPPDMLLLRTHELFLNHYNSLDELDGQPGRRKQLAKELGINDRPIFARLKSFDLSCCAPYDVMHLLFENLVPNMIKHWTGKFKKLDQGTGNYQLAEAVWKQIGKETAKATGTIPVTFVGTLPDIAEDQTLYKAEAYSFWIQYIAPIVLQDRLPEPYFEHFLLMRDIIIMSIQVDITEEQVDELQRMVNRWVIDYEWKTGPLWASWAFVMERFCGYLLPAVKNRFQPYRHLDNAVLRRAQMQVVAHTYRLPTLPRSTVKWRNEGGEQISSREFRYQDFPKIILGIPVKKAPPVDIQLTNQLTKFLGPIYRDRGITTGAALQARIDWQSMVSYGRFRMADDGYRIRTAGAVQRTHDSTGSARDNSFVRFTVLPDENASNDGSDIPYEEVNYGQLINIYYFEFITDFETNTRDHYLVGRIRSCQGTGFLDAALPENPKVTFRTLSTPDIFHLMTIDAVIGRIQVDGGSWAIIDCSRNGARTQFTNDDDDDA
ncbi:Transposase family Tnp2 protein [Ceratobasidium sp. AG-Ba]|nr:Transposase family Tnp2 protein [Ceratobasidium sp. AG-Ba]